MEQNGGTTRNILLNLIVTESAGDLLFSHKTPERWKSASPSTPLYLFEVKLVVGSIVRSAASRARMIILSLENTMWWINIDAWTNWSRKHTASTCSLYKHTLAWYGVSFRGAILKLPAAHDYLSAIQGLLKNYSSPHLPLNLMETPFHGGQLKMTSILCKLSWHHFGFKTRPQ